MAWLKKHWIKIVLAVVGGIIALLLLVVLSAYSYANRLLSSAGLTFDEAYTTAQNAFYQRESFRNKTITFLILGLDKRDDEYEKTLLTDTIVLASLDTRANEAHLVPIPRDLWIPELQTKVNALYFYGTQQEDMSPTQYVAQELENVTGVPIDYWVVLDYTKLPELIDTMGGVTVEVAASFEDNEYPNPDFLTGKSDEKYMTVSFEEGVQNMDGEKALIFVRSRKGNGDEGSDNARSRRQLMVVTAMIDRLQDSNLIQKPEQLGALYTFWKEVFITNISDSHAIAIASVIHPPTLSLTSSSIPVQWHDDTPPVLVNPPNRKYGLSVWEPYSGSYDDLKRYINNELKLYY